MIIASINDFKLLNIKCKKYFDLLSKSRRFYKEPENNKIKERFGFYLFMLESFCNEKDLEKISDFIIDTEYNDYLRGERHIDHGIDAFYIDEESREIMLFNFKFRESFKTDQKQSSNDAFISTKLINAIMNENSFQLTGKLKGFVDKTIDKLNGKDVWRLCLYMVSNEAIPIDIDESSIQELKDFYDMEVVPICLPHIKSMMSIRPSPINAELIIDNDALMSYSESTISTSKSYIVRLSAADIIRITCKDPLLRNDYNCERIEVLAKEKIDYGVLFDNVRGFVQRSKYNEAIAKSLKEEPSKFFMYNNGMTIVSKNIRADAVNGGKKVRISISDFQVLNGGQTLRTLHNFNSQHEENITDYLSKSEILVRIFNASDNESANKIAEYTNSQNSISNIDLKSLSTLQIQIEQLLDEHGIIYARKNGDTGMDDSKDYRYKISMEQFGQILFARQGNPEKSSNQKQHIFGRYYEDIFSEQNFNITEAPEIIENYFEVKREYGNAGDDVQKIEQKVFYILYIKKEKPEFSYQQCIKELESTLLVFEPKKNITDARKLIQVSFKSFLNDRLGI
ncbi:AIPR family protein [Xenorhabdus szentirmaii]|uniref:Abortive infection phage resistance protein n=2 Tax=Xenorhabdus szentirmaii TaxID=290112 RepID=W1J2B2_9GAMM|nr:MULTISPECIES: AIPR family protein [Xenorhabdus]MBD2799447.1 AIPR family protein [Xenorhabdus sp. M]MBD2806708.1 AIPR family protein [Xenorhabdus sp. ZM]PHM30960.1 abortive infection protein [Xenorhabdus szentirmaii DSM 16338]PHM44449.1 abortive infection protein [Xenorhabdus szentirmaii]CDL84208.1 putative abortive infection phage resistance protein [Xenorhabdus szentirmaii DSM 16338]